MALPKFATTGYEDPEGFFGPEKGEKKYGMMRFFVPAGETKRILFLGDANPVRFYEHSLWAVTGNGGDKEICLRRNDGLGGECPLCDKELWPTFIGYYTVLDCGTVEYGSGGVTLKPYISKKGDAYQYDRKLIGLKRGGRDKPGMLKKIQRKIMQTPALGGSLALSMWDVSRSGPKEASEGDDWNFVQKFASIEEARDALVSFGAIAADLEFDEADYAEEFKPSSKEDLERLVSGYTPKGQRGKNDPDNGGKFASGGGDDDIPF